MSDEILGQLDRSWKSLPFEYSPITKRKPIKWPNDARVAFFVAPNLEHFPIDKPGPVSLTHTSNYDVPSYSWRDYSLRIGLWRVMEMMDEYKVRGTVALNSSICKYYPEVVKACKERNWELMGHGISNSWLNADLDEKAERSVIAEVVRTIKETTGKAPQGWLGPALSETPKTLDLLAENGIKYVCDWGNDEQPYPMKVKSGTLISMPYSIELNDVSIFISQKLSPQAFYQACVDQFDILYEEGLRNGKVMCIAIHPWIIGVPFRAKYFKMALEYITKKKNVWITTGSEITEWYISNYMNHC